MTILISVPFNLLVIMQYLKHAINDKMIGNNYAKVLNPFPLRSKVKMAICKQNKTRTAYE